MTQPSSTHGDGGDILQGKERNVGQVLQGGDWALVLPTHKVVSTCLLSPENFIQIGSFVQKLFMIFQNTETWKHRHTDVQTHKLVTPGPYTGMGGNFYTLFFYLFTHYVSFVQDNTILQKKKTSICP